jgi:hypothetical protein
MKLHSKNRCDLSSYALRRHISQCELSVTCQCRRCNMSQVFNVSDKNNQAKTFLLMMQLDFQSHFYTLGT